LGRVHLGQRAKKVSHESVPVPQATRWYARRGDGIRVEKGLNIAADLRTTAGLVLTGATTPAVVAAETNGIVVSAVASSNVLGSFSFSVPKDYDKVKDELTIRVIVNSAGTTDVPTLTCTAYNKRAATALSAALTVVASAAIPNSTTKAAERSISLSGNLLQPDDILWINLVSGAHTTDAISIYGVDVVYRSNIVFTSMATR
jgi:hypothetical protein